MEAVLNIPKKNSSSEEWFSWYKLLKRKLGNKRAKVVFTRAWNSYGLMTQAPANTVDFRNQMESQGVKIQKGTMGYIQDGADDVFGAIENAMGFGRALSTSILVVGGVIVLGLSYKLLTDDKFRNDLLEGGTMVATRGASKALK